MKEHEIQYLMKHGRLDFHRQIVVHKSELGTIAYKERMKYERRYVAREIAEFLVDNPGKVTWDGNITIRSKDDWSYGIIVQWTATLKAIPYG